MVPTAIGYAKSGDVSIAYQVVGDGPLPLVLVPGFVSHLEVLWTSRPWFASWNASPRSRG